MLKTMYFNIKLNIFQTKIIESQRVNDQIVLDIYRNSHFIDNYMHFKIKLKK